MKKMLIALALLASSTAAQAEVRDLLLEEAWSVPQGRAYLICARMTWGENAPKHRPWTSDQLDVLSYRIERGCYDQWTALSVARGQAFASKVTVEFERVYVDKFWDGVRR